MLKKQVSIIITEDDETGKDVRGEGRINDTTDNKGNLIPVYGKRH